MDIVFHPDLVLLAMTAGLLLPLIDGVLTKLHAGSAVKAIGNAVLAVVAGIVSTALASPEAGIPLLEAAYAILFAFVSSAASYHSVWKPTGVAKVIQLHTADFGVGASQEGRHAA